MLLFSPGGERRGLERWRHPDFGHVDCLLLHTTADVLLESFAGQLKVTVLANSDGVALAKRWPHAALALPTKFTAGRKRAIGEPASCVALAKALIGCNNRWILTPYQLFRWCLAHGGLALGHLNPETHTRPAGARGPAIGQEPGAGT